MYAVGLMSGTSLDGIDAVLCDIEGYGNETKVKELAFITKEITQSIREKIKKCCANEASVALVCSLNFELGEIFADAVIEVCSKYNISTKQLAYVASHGQTIYHIPLKNDEYEASTFQIGESAVIAQRCQCPVISNFRVKDMAAGGQGAPLVPFSEFVLYRKEKQAVALQNIGGIGNITVIPADANIDDVYAFDTGPGNMMIDEAMLQLFNRPYDENGEVAKRGVLITKLMEELKQNKYILAVPPKTTGREMFGAPYVNSLLKKYKEFAAEDIVKTFTWFTAYSISTNIKKFVLPNNDVQSLILGGGGAYNPTLRAMIQEQLPSVQVCIQEDLGYSSDAKEAIAFVILGNQTIHKMSSNVPSATGAKEHVILGNIVYPN